MGTAMDRQCILLHRNEPRALEWLWLAARKGDNNISSIISQQLKA